LNKPEGNCIDPIFEAFPGYSDEINFGKEKIGKKCGKKCEKKNIGIPNGFFNSLPSISQLYKRPFLYNCVILWTSPLHRPKPTIKTIQHQITIFSSNLVL
jgi:hypothetical protein